MKVSHPAVGSNNVTLSYALTAGAGAYPGLDRFGRVVQQLWKDGALSGGSYDGYAYTYDRNGNVLTKDYYASGNTLVLDEQFAYDGLDRLASYKRGTLSSGTISGSGIKYQQDWTGGVDALGNWKSYANNGANQTRAHNKANETTGIAGQAWISPSYDAAGNMTSGPKAGAEGTTRLHYTYDAWNRLVRVNNDNGGGAPGTVLATYAYDGLNRRVSKSTGGNADDFYYNEGWQLLEVRRNGSSNAREQYTWDASYIDTPIFRDLDANSDGDLADVGDSTIYCLTDANHNVTSIYQPSTNRIEERYVYDPYGKMTIYDRAWGSVRSALSFENTVLYGGYVYDAETGNSYARNRYYHPTLGRWVSRDPAGYVDGYNSYEYVRSNPVDSNDPSGLADEPGVPKGAAFNDGKRITIPLDDLPDWYKQGRSTAGADEARDKLAKELAKQLQECKDERMREALKKFQEALRASGGAGGGARAVVGGVARGAVRVGGGAVVGEILFPGRYRLGTGRTRSAPPIWYLWRALRL